MKRIMASLLVVCAMSAMLMAQMDPCQNAADPKYVLKSYQLTVEQENMFQIGTEDGDQISPFWYVWDQLGTLDEKKINCVNEFAYGDEDCRTNQLENQLGVRCAYGKRGIYLLFTVEDNEFLPVQSASNGHFWDNVEIFMDKFSAADIYNPANDAFVSKSVSQLTKTTRQLQIPFGDPLGGKAATFDFLAPLEIIDDWRLTDPNQWMIRDDDVTIAEFGKEYKIYLQVCDATTTKKRMEWSIPWEQWGGFKGEIRSPAMPAKGAKVGFTFGYNDMDGVGAQTSAIRWRNQKDPWNITIGECSMMTGPTRDAWGDIEFSDALNDIISAAGKQALTWANVNDWYKPAAGEVATGPYKIVPNTVPQVDPDNIMNRNRPNFRTISASAKTEFYSITGRKLVGGSAASSKLVVRRDVDAQGKTVATSKLIAR